MLISTSAVAIAASGVLAQPSPPARLATFAGKPIDLAKGWGKAQACTVITASDIRCYASREAERAAELQELNPALSPAQALALAIAEAANRQPANQPDCPGGLIGRAAVCLYEHTHWNGRRLTFRNAAFWQDLGTWGFRNQASSWANTRRQTFWLCDGPIVNRRCRGRQTAFPGRSSSRVLPAGWSDRADFVWLG